MRFIQDLLKRAKPPEKPPEPAESPTPQPAGKRRRPTIGKAADTILLLKKSLYELGRERALAAMDTRPNEEVLASLEAHAEAMAREQGATLFNPEESEYDRLRKQEYEGALATIPKLEADLAVVADDVRKRRDGLAELGELPARVLIPWLLICFGTAIVGATVSPSLRDYFFSTMTDPRLGWVLSIGSGSVAGSFISWCLLGMYSSTSYASTRRVGLLSGVVFSISIFIIRLVGGDGRSALILAAGLGLLEIAVVIMMDWCGNGLRQRHAEYVKRTTEYERRLKVLQAAEAEFAYREKLLGEKQAVVADHVSDIADRESRVRQLDDLIRGAVQAVRDGYFAGIAELQGGIRGRDA